MNTNITMQSTVRELGDEAEARGLKASELLQELIDAGILPAPLTVAK